MIDVDITANNVASSYRVPLILGESILGLKWDSGAKYTVISVKVLNSDLSSIDMVHIKQYCEEHGNHKEQFVSASGHTFDGYLVMAHDVTIGYTVFQNFIIILWLRTKEMWHYWGMISRIAAGARIIHMMILLLLSLITKDTEHQT